MVRQTSISNPQTTEASDPEFGRWLTRDLRPKGAPLSAPPPSVPAGPPKADELLASWLTRDLTPKNSVRPRASSVPPAAALLPAAQPSTLQPFALARESRTSEPPPAPAVLSPVVLSPALAMSEPPVAPPFAPSVVDSLAPQVVPPSASLPVVAPGTLDDDDLAVLPGRRKAAASERKKYAFVLLGVLCFTAAIGIGVNRRGGSEAEGSTNAASPTDVTAALPPPPPSEDEVLAMPEEAAAPAVVRRNGTADAPDDGLDPLDPRNALGGPSVRRYADVPSPTLSRLAREQRRLQRERDEAVRKAKSAIPR